MTFETLVREKKTSEKKMDVRKILKEKKDNRKKTDGAVKFYRQCVIC